MAPKTSSYYAVAVGRKPGVYGTWAEAKEQIDGYSGARYKKFTSPKQANDFVKGNGSVILGQLGVIAEAPVIPSSFHSPPPGSETSSPHQITRSSASSSSSPHAPETIVAFTDGSALNNGRKNVKAGYAVVFPHHEAFHMSAPLTGPNPTNNRAEYTALLTCLDIVDKKIDPSGTKKVVVYTDSKLLLESVTKWMKGWKKNGWKKSDGQPVLNRDLLEAIDAKVQKRRIEMHHVLAHTGRDDWKSKWNDLVDQMARAAAQNS